MLAGRQDKPRVATQILGSTHTVRDRQSVPRGFEQQCEHDPVLAELRHRLDQSEFGAAWREKQTVSEEETVRLALGQLG
jgi:hypothetical protein